MKMIDMEKLNSEIEKIVNEREWDQFHSIKNLTMALNVEACELLEIFQWMSEKDSNLVGENPKLREKLEDEVADIFVYLLRIISKTNIDLEQVVLNKLKKNVKKYPVEFAKGNSKKYDEF